MSLSDERLEEIASSLGKSTVYGEITSALRELQSLRAQPSPREVALEELLDAAKNLSQDLINAMADAADEITRLRAALEKALQSGAVS
jgi:hypothetical protein